MSDEAETRSARVFRELVDSLNGPVEEPDGLGGPRIDPGRAERKGVPEVIYAAGKRPEQVVEIARRMVAESGRAIVSRADPEVVDRLRAELDDLILEHEAGASTVVLRRAEYHAQSTGGRVAIITAGTSDLSIAEEARIVARDMGCQVQLVSDVGVAGLHRLFRPLRRLLDEGVDVMIVVAGMDGALPSVVAGLVPVPVIGLPTSTGYGFGGNGQAALMSMLQTCAPGLTVVNIDNAVGAGASAALIANAVARARANSD